MKTTSIKSASLILMALFMSISISVRADVTPSVSLKTYYSTADGKASGQLRTALYEIINPHTTVSYDDLAYLMKYSDTQDADGTNVVDIYSNCTFTVTSDKLTWTGSGSAVGNGMNREHTVPQSWFSNASPMVSDAFHIYPTDARSNNNRSSYLYGEFTGSGTSYSSSSCSESGKLSSSSGTQTIAAYTYKGEDYYPPSTYTGKVYEPADEYKGDIARSYFYMATCYASECATWGGGAFGTDNEGFTQYTAELMLKWHRLDPVSEKELIRNEVIYGNTTYNKGTKKQGNRNPFIDYPELAEYIWGEKAGEPVSFDDLTSAYSVPCSGNLTTPNVTAVAGDQQITLTWSDVEGATSYTVSIGKGVGYTTECSSPSIGAITHSGTTNTCVITGLVNGLSYTTSVVATSSTTCDSDADLDTTTPTDTPITTHTITWSVNGTETPVVYNDGEALILPSTPSDCSGEGGKVFVGWTASSSVSGYAPADLFTEASGTVTADITYYAVYATASTSGTSASLTKLEQGDEANLALEDNIVIVAKGTNLALYQESTSTKYAKNWTFDNNVATVAADDKNYLTLYSTDDDYTTWHLGDDTNGYLYNSGSNNELVVNKTSPVYWEFKWNTTQSAYTIKRSGYTRYLSCRTDLAGSSVNLYRMVSGTGTGTAFFDIYLYVAGSGSGTTTYSNYSLTCDVPATCTNEITITKGEDPANGTFSIDNSGTVCIDEGNATVIVTAEPSEHYHLATVTTTGSVGTVGSISGNTCTITGINASTTINVTFAADPTHTATFMNCGVAYGVAQTGYAGTSISAPAGTPEACEGYMFVGWVTSEQTAEATSHSEAVTFPQTMPSSDITYYALYRRMEGGGGSATETYGFETTDDATNWEFSGVEAYDTYAKTGSKSGKIARTSVGYSSVTYKNKVNVTSFSYQFLRQTTNDNYTVFIETSSDKSTWDVAASYAMSSYSAKETWYQNSHTFDGETALYVRFNCYTSTAIRWVDDISITYNGGGTAYYTTSPSCTGHTVTVSSVEHGSATATPTYCDEGVTVTVTLIADEGYECSGITTDPVVSTSGTGCTYTFSMPASDITVTPAFVPKTPRTFTFVPGTGICATESMSEGVWNAGVTLPTATANSGCDPEYVFAGWATSSVSETEVRPTLYKAGENYNGEDLTLYAVYAQTTGGSSVGFTLSYTKDDITYYATARSGSNSYMGASTDIAEAAHFSVVTSNDKHFLCWHGTEDTYIYTGTSNNTNLSFTTDIASAKNGWTVTETDATLKLQSNGNDRYFMFNTNQKDRFAAYAAEGELTKGDAGTTTYNSAPSCTCTSVDITYNANDGELADGCENVTGGDCGRNWKLCDAPTRDGYLFSGWKDLSGNLYDAGATITDLKISLTLTAQWIPAPYTVLFDAGTGSCIESLTEASRGDGITLPKAEPSAACADDWTFIGWSETKITDEALTATIIGVSGVNYIPTANNTTLYAVYRRVDTEGATSDYSRVSDDTPVEGDYVIVVARNDESFGKMTYGTLNNGRLTYTKDYTALPATISSPAATEIWHLTYDGDGYAYLYNANAGAYLAVEDSKITYDAYGGAKFLFTRDPGTYGDFQCLNYTASDYDYYYLGANVSSDYIRYYKGQTLIDLYSVTLYQGSAGTRYYSTEPQCTPCTDPEWSFALGTSVVKSKGSAPFINTVNKVYDSAGTVTYSSTNEAVATVDNTGLVTLVGTGTTTITLRLAKAMPTCAAVLQYELEVKEPSIDVVGVTADGEIIVEHDLDGTITIDLSEGKTISTGTAANDIFFSKYFEAASNMKLFAIFNGTGHEVDLSNIRVRCNCTTAGTGVWPTKTGDFGYVELRNVSKLREQYPKLKIPSGTELIFWSNNKGSTSATITNNTLLRECVEINIGDMKYSYADMEAGEIPDWFCLGSYTKYNTVDADGNNQFIFNGDESLILERYDEATGTWVAIDLFGAGTSEAPAPISGLVEQITDEYEINGEMQALNDGAGFHDTCSEDPDEIPLSTNRYALRRQKSVLDGSTAVTSNTTSFATLCSEWEGTAVGGAGSGSDAYCNSGKEFSDIGEYDYSENYIDWDDITDDEYTIKENTDGTVTIKFKDDPKNLDARACDLLKIEVRDETDPTKVLATSEYKIPIVVKAGDVLTSADLFHNQGDKCATCDVAILGEAVLTKATDGTTNDMPTVRDIYVYGGGKLVIPSGTHYNARDLILRTQVADDKINMNVPNVQVNGSLTNQYGGAIRMQTRVGTTRFYQFAVPYVVRLEDVTFSDGTPAEYGKDFMIRYYDGEQRAINLGTVSNWRNYEGTELYPGVGYTLAVAKKTGHEQRELIFPMSGASLVDGEPATKATTIHAWGDNSIRANHRGWNFLSNPYLTTYGKNNLDDDAGNILTTGQLIPDGEHPGWWVNDEDGIPYVTIINATRTDYSQELVSLQELPPFTTFFIQAGDDTHNEGAEFSLTFDRDNRKTSAPAYIRAAQKSSVARFGVLLNGNNAQDNCGMVIGENYSAAYDMQADLSKEFGSTYSLKLYTLQEDEMPLAFQATHPDSLNKPVPVGVRLPANAEYTFSIDRRYHLGAFEHIYLTDNVTGQHTDLLEGNYSFAGTKQQNNTRFCLFVQLRKDVPTGTDNLLNGIYAVGRDGSVMLTGLPETATIYIYDMSGRLVLTRHTQGATSVTYHIPSGVYQIRVQAEGANALLRTIVY